MSFHYLPELVGASSEHTSSDGDPSVRWRSNRTAGKSSCGAKGTVCFPCSQSGTTCEPSTVQHGMESWMSSRRDFLASPSPSPDDAPAQTTNGTCGLRRSGSFAKWDRDSSSWRTYQGSLIQDTSDEYSGTWPRQGMMLDGAVSELTMLGLPTSASDSGSWPTPQASDAMAVGFCETSTARKERGLSRPSGTRIGTCLKYDRRTERHVVDGFPNPILSEWLMGYPINWTALEPLAMGRFRQWLEQFGRY
jgi:hypothetical protein